MRRRHRQRDASRLRVAAALLLFACGPAVEPSDPAEEPVQARLPNILVYVVDTLRADALASYGNPVVETPVIDGLARRGAVYPEARSTSSWTRASVASLLTGLYPEAHGSQTRRDALSPDLTVLPELLSRRGYRTGAIVANPNLGSFYGFARGFDDFIELYERSTAGDVDSEEPMATADVVTKRAIEWIDGTREPFFLFLLAIDPHDPYQPPPGFDRYGAGYRGTAEGTRQTFMRRDLSEADRARVRSLYWGEVAYTDNELGLLLGHLEARGLDDRTAVIFTSDHGEEFWEHGHFAHGHALFEESLRVPLIVRLPEVGLPDMPRDRTLDPRVRAEGVDLFPTILELAGVDVPAGTQGVSLFAPASEADDLAYASLRIDGRSLRTLVRPPWKLVQDAKRGREALFHLEWDPGETRNLRARFPGVAAQLRQEMGAIARRSAEHRIDAPQRSDADLPAHQRALLEELGYIEPEESR